MSNNYYNGPNQLGYGPSQSGPTNQSNSFSNQLSYGPSTSQTTSVQNQWGQNNQSNQNSYNQNISTNYQQTTYQTNTYNSAYQNNNYQTASFNQPSSQGAFSQNINNRQPTSGSGYTNPYNHLGYGNNNQPSIQTKSNSLNNNPSLFGQALKNGSLNTMFSGQIKPSQQQSQQSNPLQKGLDIWSDLVKNVDWDTLLKQKNKTKKQSDTSWVTTQQESWLQPYPDTRIQEEVQKKFAFPNPYIKYKIIPGVDQKMTLDVTSKDQMEKGFVKGNLIIWDYHGGPNQQFYIHRSSDQGKSIQHDQFVLINASTGFVVSAMSLSIVEKKQNPLKNSSLCVYPLIENDRTQLWRLNPLGNDIYMIQSVQTGKVLDVQGNSSRNGTSVLQWEINQQKNQLWKIVPA